MLQSYQLLEIIDLAAEPLELTVALEGYPVSDWYQLSALNIDRSKTVAQIQSTIDAAIAGKKLLTLFTHEVTNTPAEYDCTPATLSAILDYLSTKQTAGQLSVLPIRDAYNAYNGEKAVVVIAFDDAYRTDYTVAYPMFKAHNMIGTSFIAGDIIERPTEYDPGDGSIQHQRLTWFMVMQMAGASISGDTSYTVTYNPYSNVQWGSWSTLKTELHATQPSQMVLILLYKWQMLMQLLDLMRLDFPIMTS